MEGLTYESIRDEGDGALYPREILAECSSALVLFAAGFYGRHDAFWVADAGVPDVLCVDVDGPKLEAMQSVYPRGWRFAEANVYDFALDTRARIGFDLVSVDCPSGHFERCAGLVEVWCAMARRYVVLGTGVNTPLEVPDGWTQIERRRRSAYAGGTYWAVLERVDA